MTRLARFAALTLLLLGPQVGETSQSAPVLSWIWHPETTPHESAPARYFRRAFNLERYVDDATFEVAAAGRFVVWVNGTRVGEGEGTQRVRAFDVRRLLGGGKNVLAIEVRSITEPSGLLARLDYVPNGQSRTAILSDDTWRSATDARSGWQKADFDDGSWKVVKVIGPYGEAGPWRDLVWESGKGGRFRVPAGFHVEMAARNPKPDDPFSLINLTFDNRGRLLISQEKGPILLCTEPDKAGVFQRVRPYCRQVTGCQGMCWERDALLLVGDGPNGVGLYRCRDAKGRDETDEVKLLHKFKGEMGEHGPHAILHGPDDCLYVVSGNHAWLPIDKLADNSPLRRWPRGTMGPDQGKPGTTEDVLLPRQNDARGHAANILAPGGTIWRLDHEAKKPALVAAGFRNHFDAAFSPSAELFTFDSDMEWDEGLPWYRPVRICHCPPGADYLWRTGSANTPAYYIDSLPPVVETGRGSPVGLEFYDHNAFPERYRGAFFLGDWSLGLIHVAWLERNGASYKARVEPFCQGNPMNVTDLAVGPDGALYFTMGGRGSPGGVYRIMYDGGGSPTSMPKAGSDILGLPQPLSAWSRARLSKLLDTSHRNQAIEDLVQSASRTEEAPSKRLKALTLMRLSNIQPDGTLLKRLLSDQTPEVRAHAVWELGFNDIPERSSLLKSALHDKDPFVRRRACEALIRACIPVTADDAWPFLREADRFLRTAGRLLLQRINKKAWTSRLAQEPNDLAALEAMIALCKTGEAAAETDVIFSRLEHVSSGDDVQRLLDFLRVLQLALVHTKQRPESVHHLASRCEGLFPHHDQSVNRELAILLTYFAKERLLHGPVHEWLLAAIKANREDRKQQIHYFYCLRLLHDHWTDTQKKQLLDWYEATKDWQGGASFTPYLENLLRDFGPVFGQDVRERVVRNAKATPLAAIALLRSSSAKDVPPPAVLREAYESTSVGLTEKRAEALRDAIIEALGRTASVPADETLLAIGEKHSEARDSVLRALARHPVARNWRFLVGGLASSNPVVLFDLVGALRKSNQKPSLEDPAPYRNLISAASKLDSTNRWRVVQLLRHWSGGRQFGADEGDWESELSAWSRWFGQTFPKEPPLPNMAAQTAVESKYKYEDLLRFLEKEPAGRSGDAARGRLVFEKAQCLKCHKYGREGEGIGPDLTTVSKRFNRQYILESILYPSKAISDQYRSTTLVTKSGLRITGLVAPQGETLTVLQSDATKVTLKRSEIEDRVTSLVSVMPERLLDPLSRQEIADLFAYLESEPVDSKVLAGEKK